MTTWNLDHRFTASEALRFFEEALPEVAEDQLKVHVHENYKLKPYDEYDRWEGLPPDFVQKWNTHKTPPLPWRMLFLRRLHSLPYFSHIIPISRSYFYKISLRLIGGTRP